MADPPRKPVGPLSYQVPISEPGTGRPTPEFMRKWVEQAGYNIDVAQLMAWVEALRAKAIIAGDGLTGGGVLGDPGDITIALDPAQPWHPQGYVDGALDSGYTIFKLVTKTGYGFIEDAPGSRFRLQVAPTNDATFPIKHNGVQIGQVLYPAASLIGVLSLNAVVFSDYDTFEFFAPTVQDATLAGPSFLFVGYRPIVSAPVLAGYGVEYGMFYGA